MSEWGLSRSYLDCVKDNFLTEKTLLLKFLLRLATRIGALLELLLANSQELFGDVVVNSSFGCSDLKLLEVKILRGMTKTSKGIKTMDFRRPDFSLVRECWEWSKESLFWRTKRTSQVVWDIQEQHSQSTSVIHPPKWKKKK